MPERFCRLCLQMISEDFESLDSVKVGMLEKISLDLDLALTGDPLVCFKCLNTLQQSYDFKMMCLKNGNYVETFLDHSSNLKPNHEKLVEENTTQRVFKCDKESICRLCLKHLDSDSSVKFGEDDDKLLQDIVHKCFPEMELRNMNRPLMCHDCMRNCQNMFTFVANCLNNEGKVKKYIQKNGATSNGPINLSDAIKFIHDIKDEDKIIGTSIDLMKDDLNSSCGTATMKTELFEEDEIDIKNEEDISLDTEITTDLNCTRESTVLTDKHNPSIIMQKCTKCSYETKYKRNLKKHLLRHEESSNITMNGNAECSFESKYKEYLRKHAFIPKEASKVTVHKCAECNYQTKHKNKLDKHVLIHNDASQADVYKCTECSHETTRKGDLRKHMSVLHKDPSEDTPHKCTQCNYVAKRESHLRKHALVHNASEMHVHKCTECNFETIHKDYLSKHMLVHKDPSASYKCTQCSYEAKYKGNLQRHMLTHRDSSEIVKHKCTECSYESKYKSNLHAHMLKTHLRDDQV